MKPSEHLTKALQYMQEHGRTTGAFRLHDGSVCLLGALRETSDDLSLTNTQSGWSEPACRYLQALLTSQGVVQFNDDPNTTDEDVFLMFKHAIQAAEEAGE